MKTIKTKLTYIYILIRIYTCSHIVNKAMWVKKFNVLFSNDDLRKKQLLKAFLKVKFEKISDRAVVETQVSEPILFCVIKNDISKIDHFLNHYRKLGVTQFVFLDNDSDDGTKEYLEQQDGVILYFTVDKYSSVNRVAWLNRLIDIHGAGKWCLVVDSDELLDYVKSEEYGIPEVVDQAKKKGLLRIEGFMLDMYPQQSINLETNAYLDLTECNCFDSDSYDIRGYAVGFVVNGGPRRRIFNKNMQLSKYPIFKCVDNDFMASSHYFLPANIKENNRVYLVLRHYKFFGYDDLKKMKMAVDTGCYAGNSCDYKTYMQVLSENHNELCFYSPRKSVFYKNSLSLNQIAFLYDIFA